MDGARCVSLSAWALIASLVVIARAPAAAQAGSLPAAERAHILRATLDEARRRTGAPGVSAAIVKDGRILWLGQSGTVDLCSGQPVTASTMFSLASVTKMFVAASAMRLVEEGRLHLDDAIAPYVPSYLPDRRRVTVSELLGHTSGYREDEDDPTILRWLQDPNFQWTRDLLMRREGRVRFQPGTQFRYCNSCYVMLGAVIEKSGNATVGESLGRFIVAPLGLDHDVDIDRLAAFAPRIAHGYDLQKGRLVDTFAEARDLGVPTAVWGPLWTDGGIVATASGVARFTDALFRARVVSSATLAKMLAPTHQKEVVLESRRFGGRTWRGHSGEYYGYTAESWYDASRHLTITVLTNRTDSGDPATSIWSRLSATFDRLR